MAALQDIKRRIRSVRSTRQITKAMQLVAASKLRRYADAADGPKRYADVAREIVTQLGGEAATSGHALYDERSVTQAAVIVIAGDRSLAGPSNALVLREYGRVAHQYNRAPEVIAVGRQAEVQIARRDDAHELAAYALEAGSGDDEIARPITQQICDLFIAGEVDRVELIYTEFISSVTQKVTTVQLLPAVAPDATSSAAPLPTIEPDTATMIEAATRRFIEGTLQRAILSARASEQAARMIAMMNASDNAAELIDDYTLDYNNARQAAITQELAEISAGAEAMA